MAAIPFLKFPNDSQLQVPSNFQEAISANRNIRHSVLWRSNAIKIVGCVCLPIAILSCCCREILNPSRGYYADSDEIPYSNYTRCSGGSFWKPKLLPRNNADICQLACDPCICCVCYTDGSPQNFLTPPERQVMDITKKIIRDKASDIAQQNLSKDNDSIVAVISRNQFITEQGIKRFQNNQLYHPYVLVDLIAEYAVDCKIPSSKEPQYIEETFKSYPIFSHRYY